MPARYKFLLFAIFIIIPLIKTPKAAAADQCKNEKEECGRSNIVYAQCCSGRECKWVTGNPIGIFTCEGPAVPTCNSSGGICIPASQCSLACVFAGQLGCAPGTRCCDISNPPNCTPPTTPSPTPTPTPTPTPSPSPTPPPKDPKSFPKIPCDETVPKSIIDSTKEFDPTRPYPGSPCDPLIPKSWPEKTYLSFACGKSLTPKKDVELPKYVNISSLPIFPANPTPGVDYRCSAGSTQVCRRMKLDFDVEVDVSPAAIPILGNSEMALDAATKMNEYLLNYLAGGVQSTDQKPLDPSKEEDRDKLINLSGPIKKLLPYSMGQALRRDLVEGPVSQVGPPAGYHNYQVGCNRIININPLDYFQAVKDLLSSLWDLGSDAGELTNQILDFMDLDPNKLTLLGRSIIFGAIPLQSGDTTQAKALQRQILQDAEISGQKLGPDIVDKGVEIFVKILPKGFEVVRDIGAVLASFRPIAPNQGVACAYTNIRDIFNVRVRLQDDSIIEGGINDNLPPNPTDYPDDYKKYHEALLRWYGYWFVGPFHFAPLTPNVWATLFQNVPFTTLEDTVAEVTVSAIDDPRHQPPGVITKNPAYPITLRIRPSIEARSDARIYVPHTRSTNALAKLLQSFFNPGKSEFDQKKQFGLLNEDEHQKSGDINETTGNPIITVNDTSNNQSVVPGEKAPDQLFGPPVVDYDSTCDLKDVRYNPGDNLLGDTINAHLTYFQDFKYSPTDTGGSCIADNLDCNPTNNQCCSQACNLRQDGNPSAGYYCAPAASIKQSTQGRVAVFTKTPNADNLFETLVAGTMSIYKRFLYRLSDHNIELKDIPAVATVGYSAPGAQVTAGDGSGGPEIYFPRLGSVYDYFLKGLQKALRPQGIGSPPPPPPTNQMCHYSKPEIDTAISSAAKNVPESQLRAIYNIENYGYTPGDTYTCSDNSAGAAGPFQITGGAYDDVTCPQEKVTQDSCDQFPGKLSRCNIADAAELASRVLLYKLGRWDTTTCKPSGQILASSLKDVYNSSYGYYGSWSPDSATEARAKDPPALPLRSDGKNRNYSDVVCGRMGLCPPYPPQQWQ